MFSRLKFLFLFPIRYHAWGSLSIVVFATAVISTQVSDRRGFANSELYEDVLDRWGTPIDQPAPSVRYVESGTVFTTLEPLALSRQTVAVKTEMSYRKRGLVYFSGFEFVFDGEFAVENPEPHAIDIVFVFPVSVDRNRVLLSEFEFRANGERESVALTDGSDTITWTGRLPEGGAMTFNVSYAGRGLDAFTYRLDPKLPARNVQFDLTVFGGGNYDYPGGIVPAHRVEQTAESAELGWSYPSLESGVPLGAVLPSEHSFDQYITTMSRRSFVPFLVLFAAVSALAAAHRKRLRFYSAYLFAAAIGFYYVLLAYLAAFTNFYLAFVTSSVIMTVLLSGYLRLLIGEISFAKFSGLVVACLITPNAAVIAEGYTGLIYTLEILAGLTGLMWLSTRDGFTQLLDRLFAPEGVTQ
ncbi:MAG: hypothetical protein AAF219_00295 [Myxococcota bacterium]